MEPTNNKSVFDIVAPNYIREDNHWGGADLDIVKITIDKLLRTKEKINYLDIGCGNGFHITTIGEFYPEINVLGIDFSVSMLKKAKKRINVLKLKNVKVREVDITESKIFGKYDIITFLNNGIGNIYRKEEEPTRLRTKVLKKIHRLLKSNSFLILSVYNKEKLRKSYGPNLRLIKEKSNLKTGDLFVKYKGSFQSSIYYSHWFSSKELKNAINREKFKIDFFEKRNARLLIRAKSMG